MILNRAEETMETTDEKIALLIERIEFRSMKRLGLIPGYKTFEEW